MKPLNLFISIPMHGREDKVVWEEMCNYRDLIEKYYNTKVNLIDNFHKEREMNRVEMLGDSICLMGKADLILFAPKWYRSKGCRIEHEIVLKYIPEALVSQYVREKIFGNEVYDEEVSIL